jgi:hypothetical protein
VVVTLTTVMAATTWPSGLTDKGEELRILRLVAWTWLVAVFSLFVVSIYQVAAGHGDHPVPGFLVPVITFPGYIILLGGSFIAGGIIGKHLVERLYR